MTDHDDNIDYNPDTYTRQQLPEINDMWAAVYEALFEWTARTDLGAHGVGRFLESLALRGYNVERIDPPIDYVKVFQDQQPIRIDWGAGAIPAAPADVPLDDWLPGVYNISPDFQKAADTYYTAHPELDPATTSLEYTPDGKVTGHLKLTHEVTFGCPFIIAPHGKLAPKDVHDDLDR